MTILQSWNVIGQAQSYQEAIQMIPKLSPNVVMTDLLMSEGNGFDLTQYILKEHPSIKTLIMTGYATPEYIRQAYQLGAQGIIDKQNTPEEFVKAIQLVIDNQKYFPPEILGVECPSFNLSTQQKLVLNLLIQGYSRQAIAKELNISLATVSTHFKRIKQKYGLKTISELVLKTKQTLPYL